MSRENHSAENIDAQLPADQELEKMAVQRADQESVARMPQAPEEMIAATGILGPLLASIHGASLSLDTSALEDIFLQIQLRLQAFLQIEKKRKGKAILQPSAYARSLLLCASADPSPDDLVVLSDMTAHVVADINPLLHAAWSEYEKFAKEISLEQRRSHSIPVTVAEFFELLESTLINGQNVHSFFGVLKTVAAKHDAIPSLNQREAQLPREIVVLNPFAKEMADYWTVLSSSYSKESGKPMTIPELVLRRTEFVVHKLKALEEQSDSQPLKEASHFIRSWLLGEQMNIQGMRDADFDAYLPGLHFGYGDPKTQLTLLNSMEILKQHEPELFIRMLGRNPNPYSPSHAQSDLFGNILHAALYRSLHAQGGGEVASDDEYQTFLTGLTRLEKQELIDYISDQEIAALGKMIARRAKKGNDIAMPLVTYLSLLAPRQQRAYAMRKRLERLEAENRERLLDRLRVAPPSEFFQIIARMHPSREPNYYRSHPIAGDIQEIVRARGFIGGTSGMNGYDLSNPSMVVDGIVSLINPPSIYRVATSGGVAFIIGKQWESAARLTLWKTAPSTALLSTEFFGDVLKWRDVVNDAEESHTRDVKEDEKRGKRHVGLPRNETVRGWEEKRMLETLAAHPAISKVEWIDWWKKQGVGKSSFLNTLREHLSPRDVIGSPSNFFVLLGTLGVAQTLAKKGAAHFEAAVGGIFSQWKHLAGDSKEEYNASARELRHREKGFPDRDILLYKMVPTDVFFEKYWQVIMSSEPVTKFPERYINLFFHTMSEENRKDLLREFFRSHSSKGPDLLSNKRLEAGKGPGDVWLLFVLRWAERIIPDDSGYQWYCNFMYKVGWPVVNDDLTGPPSIEIRLMRIDGTWQVTRRSDSGDWVLWPHEDDTFEFS